MQKTAQIIFTTCLALLVQQSCVHGTISRRCKDYIRIKSTAQSKFELPKTSIFRPRCSINQFIWYRPRQDHIITFHQSRQSFTLCLSRVGEGMSIYQLRGTSRKLLAGSNATGELGCFESECKHLTLYFDVESSLKVSRISYTYRSKIINRCPKCTEVCQRNCICSSQYVFVGMLQRSVEANGLYTHYMKVSEFLKHNGLYNKFSRWLRVDNELKSIPQCPSNNASKIQTYDPFRTSSTCEDNNINSLNSVHRLCKSSTVPQYGLVKVYSKCPMTIGSTHLISASVSSLTISGRTRKRLVMCCGEEDQTHAAYQLREMLLRQQCCSELN